MKKITVLFALAALILSILACDSEGYINCDKSPCPPTETPYPLLK